MKKSLFRCWLWGTAVWFTVFLAACTSPSPTTPEPVVVETVPPTAAPTATAVPTCEPFTETAVAPPAHVSTYSYQIINSYPHDPEAFTQGLLFVDGVLYESTGRYPSSLRQVDLASGEPQQLITLDEQYFGEGLVLWQNKLIQLTWQNGTAFVYDKESFQLLNTWRYDTEGWGITHNGRCLIMSDGSDTLFFRHPETFEIVGRIVVQDQNGPVRLLNELEYINGEIWANIWQTDRIVRIDPATGQVVGSIDFTGLLDPATLTQPANVLNGIAYDAENGRLFITGKLWPTLFEIQLVPEGNN